MPRMRQIEVEQASGLVRNLFGKVEKSLGLIPNMFRCMANSTMGFDGFLKLNASLMAGNASIARPPTPRWPRMATCSRHRSVWMPADFRLQTPRKPQFWDS